MKEQTLTVQAIENGTVIDHIPAGEGLKILYYFNLEKGNRRITVGFNLASKTEKFKDLIKIEDIFFTEEHIQQIAFFAPHATINIIKNYEVVKKITPEFPTQIQGIFECPNQNCASHGEPVKSFFYVKNDEDKTKLKCYFCEKIYPFELVSR